MTALAIVVSADQDGGALAATLAAHSARDVSWLAAEAVTPPARARNHALARTTAPYVAFFDPPGAAAFCDAAARLLDAHPEIDFVTGWGEGLPAAGQPPQSASLAALVGRPWFSPVPTLFRRAAWQAAGGYDEALVAGEELDLALRLLESGRGGLVLAWPHLAPAWGGWPAAADCESAAARLFAKHRGRLEQQLADVLVAKERTVRELVEHSRALQRALLDPRGWYGR
jgi:hypothetical protein